jgi:DNA-binding NarL/FixJ family response regulator
MSDTSEKISVLIVDDHAILREGVRMILDNDKDITVAGEAANIEEACRMIDGSKPDVVLLDLDLGSESSLDHMDRLTCINDGTKILILTGVIDEESNRRAADGGARGVVLKNDAASSLLSAIKKVHNGEVWFDRAFTGQLIERAHKARVSREIQVLQPIATLTEREREIAIKIGEGLVNKDIGKALGISEKTVRNTLTTIYEKLGVEGRLELALFLSKSGIDLQKTTK